jgi:ADP-heptose:LPS heptosyltransferase
MLDGDSSAAPHAAPIDLTQARRVLAVKLSSFGDIVHVTPCVRALRQACPNSELLVVANRTWAPLFRSDPHVDGVIVADPARSRFLSSFIGAYRALAARRGPRFDLAIDFQGRPRSAAWVYASRARYRVGRGGLRPGWHKVVRPDMQRHAVQVCAEIAERAGIAVIDLEPRLFCSEAADRAVEAKLHKARASLRGFVLVNPFGRWPSKVWPVERWAVLIQRIRSELGLAVVVSGGPGEEPQADRLLALMAPSPPPSTVGQTTLEEALCLYRRALLAVSGDSGPMHAAAAVGTPVVALFGATWPEQTGPWGAGHHVLQVSRAAFHHAYPDDAERRHIEAIDAGAVLAQVLSLSRIPRDERSHMQHG